jgi:hypothetical protein
MKQVNAIDAQVKSIANKMALANIIKLSSSEATDISEAVASANGTSKKWQKMADNLWANGKRPEHFDRKEALRIKDNEMIRFHESINLAIVSSYDVEAQKLYNADPESLNMSKQVERTVLRKQVSDHFSNVKKAVAKLQAGKEAGKDGGKDPATSNLGMVVKNLEDSIKRLEAEKKPYVGIVDDIKNAKALLVSIRKQAK